MQSNKNLTDLSRRSLIKCGGGFLGTGLLATVIGKRMPSAAVAAATPKSTDNLTPEQALTLLMEGNQRFVTQKRDNPNQDTVRLIEVSEGQTPFAALLSCADSRVPVEIVFDQGLGDLFVCRIAGNIATSEQIGSLEFGTMILGAKVLMVMGHSRCGALSAALEGGRFPGQIGSLVSSLQVGAQQAQADPGEDKLETAIKANIMHQVELLNQSAILGDLVDQGKLKLVGGYYDLDDGTVTLLG